MQITVQLQPQAARVARSAHETWPADLVSLEDELGAPLEPLHPDSTDPVLQTFFVVEVADEGTATRLLDTLRRHPLVAAAYVKPAAETP